MNGNIRNTQRSFEVVLGGDCYIKDTSVSKFHPGKKVKHPKFTLKTPFGTVEKEFVRVVCLSGGKMRRFLADKVTGTIYNRRTGKCYGSQHLEILMG